MENCGHRHFWFNFSIIWLALFLWISSLFQATPEGQMVFDRLLKACNEVVWHGESILVLNQIQVDPPYSKEDCKLLGAGGASGALNEGSLDRVKKIVAAASDR
mmetsp:Transcript_17850/g.26198  ORF Transcript_17850/g.26198 Transcript_17850/m.26198 type:complete len:103 (+) Transcript_17850:646-954(+)